MAVQRPSAGAAEPAGTAPRSGSPAPGPANGSGPANIAQRRLSGILRCAAVAAMLVGLLHTTGAFAGRVTAGPVLDRLDVLLAVAGVAALAQLLHVRMRTGRGLMWFGWGEAAVIVACHFLPTGLVPVAFFVGVLVAQAVLLRIRRITSLATALSNVAVLTLAATVSAVVGSLAGVRPGAPFAPAGCAALVAAGVTYCLVTVLLSSALIAAHLPQPYRHVALTALRGKAPMAASNIVISTVGLYATGLTRWWLVALPPAMWLLHQTFSYRLRADDERRAWQVFAEATRELNHVDEAQAAGAGLTGAHRLFSPRQAEIVIDGPPGAARRYTLDRDGSVRRGEWPVASPAQPVAVRPLLAGGTRIGELRLLHGPTLNRRDVLILSAYGDALAASLHDAATNTELRSLTERSSYDAVHDVLTGLANRTSLLLHGAAMLHGLDPDAPVALLLLDINHFKEVNNTLGHGAGDELLRIAARRLAGPDTAGELLARLGGDEFALLMTNGAARLPAALERAGHLTRSLAEPIEVVGLQLSVEASIGVVAASAGEVDMNELLRRADIAMYQAKRDVSGMSFYDHDRDDASTDRLALLAELREALTGRDQVELLLQPVVALDTGRPVSVEAFVRWRHPRRGTLKPVHFVRAVEQSELLGPFTRYVLERALAVGAELAGHGLALPVSVNLSPRSLHDRQLPADIAHLLARFHIPAEGLILEITETVVLSELKVVDEVLGALRSMGVQLAVDDFGTGCSALTFLTRVPVDEVKVDRTFVTRMVDSPEAAAIVRTTVQLGKELGLRVVAEGVETAGQRRALAALGCQLAQGFHFYAPMPAARMVEVLREVAQRPGPVRRLRAAE